MITPEQAGKRCDGLMVRDEESGNEENEHLRPKETDGAAADSAAGRTRIHRAELARANAVLRKEISERRRVEEELRKSLGRLQTTLENTIRAMALTMATRDAYTADHQRRVADLGAAIATEMGLSAKQAAVVRLAGTVHDIGKIHIPAEILSKPGRISDVEFSLIKVHPQVGYEILSTIEFPWPIAEIVWQHHERLDGTGYPLGLAGENILVEARILGVADVVEAMASHRPYRPALGMEKAIQEIVQNRGTAYDPGVVDACARVVGQTGFQWG